MRDEKKTLDRYLTRTDVWAMAYGCMVGWGVFAMPGNTFLPVAGPLGTLTAMLISMIVMLVIGANFSYLMSRSPITGGVYSYTKDAFGRDHAFLSSWFLCLSYLTVVFLNGTALFYIVRILFSGISETGIHYTVSGNTIYLKETLISGLVLAGTGLLFVYAKPALQKLHKILALVMFLGITLTAAFCVPKAIASGAFADFGTQTVNRGYAVFSLVILAPWAFVGFEVTSFETAHFDFPVKKTGKIIVMSIIAATFAYASMALVSVSAVPDTFSSWQDYISSLGGLKGVSSVPTFYAARSAMGPFGLAVMAATAAAAILTGIIGGYRATTRVLSTMAEDHILSERFQNTTYAIVFIMIISIVLSFWGRNTLNWFVDLTSLGAIVAYGYTSAAAWKIAKSENNKRTVMTGAAGTAISLVFVLVQLVPRLSAMEAMGSEAFFLLALWCLLGFVFYWRTINNSTMTEYSGMSASGTVLFALLIYSSMMWLAKLLMAQESVPGVRAVLLRGGVILMIIVFTGLAVMIHIQDLVRRKNAAVEREKIRIMEGSLAKSRFLFNMSHDIRTPMNAIIGYTDLALKDSRDEKTREYLTKIDSSSKHLLSLINDILEMSRIENGALELEFAPADIVKIFEDIRDLFSGQMKQKGIAFSVFTSQIRHRSVWCDMKNLNRVLLNIVGNAYKFTEKGGSVTVSLLESAGAGEGYASYEIRVQDTGIGMSKEFAERMFNAFERERTSTDSGIEGTGLGLAITKNIVDLMGGTIEVMTAPGSGTEMIIRLKFRLADENEIESEEEEPAPEAPADLAGRRVLLVEDNAINMEIAQMILEQMGLETDTAENGQIALDKVKSSSPGYYDVILMDIQMPVMDGYTCAKAIRALDDRELASVPIIAMTANAFKEDVDASLNAGMQGHVSKPIDIKVLADTIGRVTGGR